MNEIKIQTKIKEFNESVEKYNKSFFGFFKNISTLAVALIGLLIGLKPSVIPNQDSKLFFLLSIILLGLCILFSLIVQHYELNFLSQLNKIRGLNIEYNIENRSEKSFGKKQLKKHIIYALSELMTYFCFVISIVMLIFYVYYLEF